MFRRKPLHQELKDVAWTLQLALTKIQVAINFVRDREKRRSFIMNVTLITAVHGMPVTPDMMCNMYLNDALHDIKKAKKKISKIINKLRNRRISLRLMKLLSTVEKEINELESLSKNPIGLSEKLKNIIGLIQDLRLLVELEVPT